MKNTLLYLLLIAYWHTAYSQRFDLSAGFNINQFYDVQGEVGHFIADYRSRPGYDIRLGYDAYFWYLPFRFTLGLSNYSGDIYNTYGGLGGGATVRAKLNNTIFSLGVYPANFNFLANRLHFNFGSEFGFLLSKKITGTKHSWQIGMPSKTVPLDEKGEAYIRTFRFGFIGRAGYLLRLRSNVYLLPQYLLYIGLNREMDNISAHPKALRHSFSLGVVTYLYGKPICVLPPPLDSDF